jgi:hypothetical protein
LRIEDFAYTGEIRFPRKGEYYQTSGGEVLQATCDHAALAVPHSQRILVKTPKSVPTPLFTVTRNNASVWPVRLKVQNGRWPERGESLRLSVSEAEALRDLLVEFLAPPAPRFVRVRYAGQIPSHLTAYTYIDPFGDLKVGDLVDVPTVGHPHNLATVVSVGDTAPKGNLSIKTVTARYVTETP